MHARAPALLGLCLLLAGSGAALAESGSGPAAGHDEGWLVPGGLVAGVALLSVLLLLEARAAARTMTHGQAAGGPEHVPGPRVDVEASARVALPAPALPAPALARSEPRRPAPEPAPDPRVVAEAPPASSRGPRLRLESGGLVVGLERGGLHLGRAPESSLPLDDPRVCSRHASVLFKGGRFVVQDCGSEAGTQLNDERLPPWQTRPLLAGDRIRIGPFTLRFED